MTEQPFKTPYYAALLRLLHEPSETAPADQPLGRLILEDFWKGFQGYLDKVAWRETRLCVSLQLFNDIYHLFINVQIQFFTHLTMAGLISPESMFALLQSFTAVLDEFGVSHGRAKRAALCAGEGLMIVSLLMVFLDLMNHSLSIQGGPILKATSSTSVTEIINAIQAYNDTTTAQKWLVAPSMKLASGSFVSENGDEVCIYYIIALWSLKASLAS